MTLHEHRHHQEHRGDRLTLIAAVAIAVVLVSVELVGSALSHSLSILSDAIHLSSDVAAYVIGIMGISMSMRPRQGRFQFGYDRAEVLTSLLALVVVWAVTLTVAYTAVHRILAILAHQGEPAEIQAGIMLVIATIAMVGNLTIVGLLHWRSRCGALASLNIRAALLHALGDCLQSATVVLAAALLRLRPTWLWLDAVGALVSSVIILGGSVPMLSEMSMILMEACPLSAEEIQLLHGRLATVSGVEAVKDVVVWSLGTKRQCAMIKVKGTKADLGAIKELVTEAAPMTASYCYVMAE